MHEEKQLKILIESVIVACKGQARNEALVFITEMEKANMSNDFIGIQFCTEKLCEYYEADYNLGFDSLLNLRKTIQKYNLKARATQNERERLYKFWVSFSSWYEQQKKSFSSIFADSCICGHYEENMYERPVWIEDSVVCNEQMHYRIEYGEEFVEPNAYTIKFENIKNYIELIYATFLKPGKEGKYPFVVQVNNTFAKFGLPYKISNGKIKRQEYKTSHAQDRIFNYEQFERKINFSEEMILHTGMMDKHAALEYIADSFCYFYSLYKKENDSEKPLSDQKVNSILASMVHPNTNDKQYLLIKDEIETVKRIINNDYDIRHNEYYRSEDKSNREILSDEVLIEYLYNRIYSLLFILRLKHNSNAKSNEIIEELPF